MRPIQRVGDLGPECQHRRHWQRTLLQPVCERLALQQLHDQVVGAVLVTDVIERADVGMAELRDSAGLALEAGANLRRRGKVRCQHLDRHVPP